MFYEKRWVQAWLGLGFAWFLAAIALAPSNKLYQQGLLLFLWLPTLLLAWPARHLFAQAWRRQRALWASIALLLAWSAATLAWSSTEEGSREVKRLLYILVFLMAFPLLAPRGEERSRVLLRVGGALLAVAALVSIIRFYSVLGYPLNTRLEGIGEISHPILGAYVIGAAIIWLLFDCPRNRGLQLGWLAALACLGAFVALTQSRGALLSVALTVLLAPLWFRSRFSGALAMGVLVVGSAATYMAYDLIMLRGSSYRPEIFQVALQMIGEHPWTGLGLGAFYRVEAAGLQFDHTHNMFTHVAVELGLPGMLLWIAVWLFTLGEIIRARSTPFGKVLLSLWVFSTLAMQFDAASLTGTPRAEWFVSWLPVGLAMLLPGARPGDKPVVKSPVQPVQRA
ncbi:putative lipopolysaccharide core biosynthesis protein [Pseudomonas entomophila L48]|uniref:Putative lipopolysaccharide core biosynthesis protein n=1 Tax=Pseudomonas entomophila (strain L48) TaxID=384676 RepID=Q1I409_PSEE4|nr:O-antigen ligase family protein [Pseudomonas entomophila]CAK17627.1 putative lipopolysaccharide core biosynthesis protein [Pseudomonas entomophila L48]